MTDDTPTTLIEAVRYFSDLDACDDYLRRIRWPTGTVRCPHCNSAKCRWMADNGIQGYVQHDQRRHGRPGNFARALLALDDAAAATIAPRSSS